MPSTDNHISRVDHSVAHTTMRQQLRDQLIVALAATVAKDGIVGFRDPGALVINAANRLAMAAYPEDPA